MIELRTLAYFAAACRSDSLARAADELGIAVSTLSMTMKTLERDIGRTLFRRIDNSLYPTEAARFLMRAAEPMLAAEGFARRWVAAPARSKPRVLTVDFGLSFTIGGMSGALRDAVEKMAGERPDVFVDAIWTDDKDSPHLGALAADWSDCERSRVTIAFADNNTRAPRRGTAVLLDEWLFACRLPAGTRKPPTAAELAAGRIVVPLLATPLLEQADRYFTQNRFPSVRFLNDHPGDLPRLIAENPDAAFFVPRSLATPRLGLLNVATIAPRSPLTTIIVAHAATPGAIATLFIRHLQRAFGGKDLARTQLPVVSFRQVRYFAMVHRLRRVSAAAHAANISQPAFSEQLHKLEASLGGPLFERRDDGLVPTARADRFAAGARLIEHGFRRLSDRDDAATAPQSRRIVVGILPSVSQHGFLVNRITEAVLGVQARYPALKLVVQEAPNGTLQDWVRRGLVGVAIVETALPHTPRLPLGSSEELAAVVHTSHKLLPPGPVKLADLARLKLVLPTNRFGLRHLLDAAAGEQGLKIQPHVEIDALPMAVAILARLPVATVLPASAVAHEIADGELSAHPIVEPTISRRLFLIYSGERALSEPERSLVNTLRRSLSEQRRAD